MYAANLHVAVCGFARTVLWHGVCLFTWHGVLCAATDIGDRKVSEAHDLGQTFVEVDGPTNTVFGMVSALTRYSQLSEWAGERVEIDGAAAQLMVRLAA